MTTGGTPPSVTPRDTFDMHVHFLFLPHELFCNYFQV